MNKIIIILTLLSMMFIAGCSNEAEQKTELDLVVTKVGFNPVFYPLDNNKI